MIEPPDGLTLRRIGDDFKAGVVSAFGKQLLKHPLKRGQFAQHPVLMSRNKSHDALKQKK
jgi:hypothetical protein